MTTATPETTAAADPKADAAAKKAEKAAAKKAEKEAAAKAKADAKEAQKQPEQNDVRRPKPDTLCGKAWAAYDAISAKNGAPATIKEAIAALKGTVDAEATVRTQYARWRKFHGISGRVAAPAPAPTPPAA
jgi:hypothetical protein